MNSQMESNEPESVTREASSSSSRKRKRRKPAVGDQDGLAFDQTRWKTESEQQIYSSKLVKALHYVCRNHSCGGSSSSPTTARIVPIGRDVKLTADRVLAAAAKGKTRWSRAMLKTSRLRLRIKKVKQRKVLEAARTCRRQPLVKKKLPEPVLDNRMRILSHLVPGCRKLPYFNILEEATDYIAALEMQVRAMTSIVQLINGLG